MSAKTTRSPDGPVVSRRRALGLIGIGAVGAGLATTGVAVAAHDSSTDAASPVVPFFGDHQAGIATPVQAHLHFASFDVTTSDRDTLTGLLQRWTAAAAQLTAGRDVGATGAVGGPPLAPPEDTGEALGHDASRLTLTFGFGPSLFDRRFGLVDRRPAALADLPAFAGDALQDQRGGGDLCIQACADDPQVAVHAIRNLTRLAAGVAAVRWAQLGFGRAATTDTSGPTPRNLFGFKDGTANILATDQAHLQEHVWAGTEESWMAGGSYLVARDIRMMIETWDRTPLGEQEQIFGRTKSEGAPLGRTAERDRLVPAELAATSHVRLAHPDNHGGARMLRRGFNTVDGTDGLGHLSAGLFFLAYQRDPRQAFVPVQTALSRHDAMNEYVRHVGSSLWAVPPGVQPGGWIGQTLL